MTYMMLLAALFFICFACNVTASYAKLSNLRINTISEELEENGAMQNENEWINDIITKNITDLQGKYSPLFDIYYNSISKLNSAPPYIYIKWYFIFVVEKLNAMDVKFDTRMDEGKLTI